jgi:hypothetical protein
MSDARLWLYLGTAATGPASRTHCYGARGWKPGLLKAKAGAVVYRLRFVTFTG